jgi:hypothetical protein
MYNDGNVSFNGHVRIFEWNNEAWNQLGDDIDGEAWNDQSGFSVALSSDGSTVAIGSKFNDGNGTGSGHVRIFEWNNETLKQLGDDIDGKAVLDHSGFSVALSSDGSTVAIGAPRNKDDSNVFTSNVGHVRVYNMDVSQFEVGAVLSMCIY